MTQLGSMGGDTAADFTTPAGGGETVPPRGYELKEVPGPLDAEELRVLDAWWRAANYLAVGQIYLMANPLLREPLRAEHVKPRLLGSLRHGARAEPASGRTPTGSSGNAISTRCSSPVPVTAAPARTPAPGWRAPTRSCTATSRRDAEGMATFFRQFSFPGGVPSHCAPETPGSFHEGGELGYSLLHAFGAAFDNPDLVVFCVVGDGEAETGPLATSWHCDQVRQPRPRRRGAADPAPQRVQDRQPDAARPDPRGGAAGADARLRLRPVRRGRATTRRRCTRRWRPRWSAAWTGSRRSSVRHARAPRRTPTTSGRPGR